jgi:hypothetical protein
VLTVGSQPVELGVFPAGEAVVVDAIDPRCPVVGGAETQLPNGDLIDISRCQVSETRYRSLVAESGAEVVVVSLGPFDSGIVRHVDEIGFPAPTELAAYGNRIGRSGVELTAALATLSGAGRRVIVVDNGLSAWMRGAIDRSVLELEGVTVVNTPAAAAAVHSAVEAFQVATTPGSVLADAPLRLLVIGDSTSLMVAKALNDGSAGRLELQWAGGEGCPFVRVTATRANASAAWVPTPCEPYESKLPPLVASFHPDAILIVAGAMELLEQRYPGSSAGRLPGSAEYAAYHDAEMAAFMAMVRPWHLPVLVADAPPVTGGLYTTLEMTDPARLRAWNEQIARWDSAYDDLAVLPYAAPLAAYEQVHGSIRSDGSHPDIGPLTDIARTSLVDPLIAIVHQLAGVAPTALP